MAEQIIEKGNVNFLQQVTLEDGFFLLVDKPLGWTSFDVVAKLRNTIRKYYGLKKLKVGHAGTLDPMATGLLMIAVGKATKKIEHYQGLTKTYSGEIQLGAITASYDAEQPPEHQKAFDHIVIEQIKSAAEELTGDIQQIPPIFSAIKKDGQPLYKMARKGVAVEVEPRPVSIYSFDVQLTESGVVNFEVSCSKGTYIRTLAHDLGQLLGCGAYLKSLRRTKNGLFAVDTAWSMDDLIPCIQQQTAS